MFTPPTQLSVPASPHEGPAGAAAATSPGDEPGGAPAAATLAAAAGASRAALRTAYAGPGAPAAPATVPQQGGPGTGPSRGTPSRSRTGPPGRRDTRRPGAGRSRPAETALRAAAQHRRAQQPHTWFAGQFLLVLSGQRPAHSLLGHVRGAAFDELSRLAPLAPLRPRGTDRSAPVLASAGARQPCTGVVEAFARIVTGGRSRVLAFRLEACDDRRWRCSALELDDRPPASRAGHAGRRP